MLPVIAVSIKDHFAINIARRAADGLDKAGLAERRKPSLSASRYAHQPAFGNVEAFAQQVDPDQHVIDAQAQIADQLDPLQRFDIGVHIADPQTRLVHEFGQIFRHPLGQRGNKRAVPVGGGLPAFL